MRDTNKGFMAVKVKQDTYILLKTMAAKNNCSLAALIHEAVSKLTPDDAGNIYNKVSHVETHLQELDSNFTKLNESLSRLKLIPMMSPSTTPYYTDAEIKEQEETRKIEREEYRKQHAADEAKREEYRKSRAASNK
jgi:hypothetical protein